MLFHKPRPILFSLRFLLLSPKQLQNPIPSIRLSPHRLFSSSSFSEQSCLSVPRNTLIQWPSLPITKPSPSPNPNPNPNPGSDPAFSDSGSNLSRHDFSVIANLFTDPSVSPGPVLHAELDRSGIEPGPTLLRAVFDHFGSSPKLLHSLFLWAEKRPGFDLDPKLFDSVVNVLAKSREFDSAWTLVLDHINDRDEKETLVSIGTFAIMIRRYARAGGTNILQFRFSNCSI